MILMLSVEIYISKKKKLFELKLKVIYGKFTCMSFVCVGHKLTEWILFN